MDVRPIALVVTAVAQCCLLVVVEIGFRRGLGPETTRQIAHVAGAASLVIVASAPAGMPDGYASDGMSEG